MTSFELQKSKINNVKFGNNVKIIEPVNIYDCEIGNECFVGPFVEIQKDVLIGNSCKVQSHSFICEKVKIGNNCVIAHGVMFINDKFSNGEPAFGNKKLWKSTTISDRVYIGSNATILPIYICSDVVIGAGSVVTKDISKPGTYIGNPATLLK